MILEFNSRFLHQENQVYIAMSGKPVEIADKLRKIATDIEKYGKPIQENLTTFGLECQIKTPIWNNKRY